MRTDGCVLGRLTHQVCPIRKSGAQGSGVYNILCAICLCRLLAIPHVLMKFASVRALDKPAGQGENMAAVEKQFEGYVTSDAEILGGEPVLVGTRLRLETVLKCYEDRATP